METDLLAVWHVAGSGCAALAVRVGRDCLAAEREGPTSQAFATFRD